jgi:nitrate reductase gamma subunit
MEPSNIFTGTFVYDFVRGPLVWVAFFVFIAGTCFQVFRFLSMSTLSESVKLNPGPSNILPKKSEENALNKNWFARLKLSIAGVNPFMTILTTVFHVLLVLMPLFVLGHNILLDNAFGISFFSLSEEVSDFLTLIVIICALIFLCRRLFSDRVCAITTHADFLFLFLAAAPFITGYLAYNQVFTNDYRVIITLHILSGELMLMAIPFTKFVHMIYFFIARFAVVSEWSLGKGKRTW